MAERARILMIDDDPDLRHLTSCLLEEAGYEVLEAATGEEGLRLTFEEQPDLVLLDVVLPGMDGLDVCRRIKADASQPVTLVALLSNFQISSENQATGLEAGADEYIVRPVDNREFLARVAALLRIKRAEDALLERTREKELLLQEIHHRVKNNLQVISSLLDMQSLVIQDPEASQALQDSRHRVKAMAFVHDRLYQFPDVTSIDVGNYVHTIAEHLFGAYGARAMKVSLDIQTDDIVLDLDSAIPCGLIINELVSNALKHAFPPENTRAGHIRIGFHSLDHDQLALSVSDDGAGLPYDLVLDQPPSLGLRLVTMLTRQLGGKIEMISNTGTAFKIIFPHAGHNSSGRAEQ